MAPTSTPQGATPSKGGTVEPASPRAAAKIGSPQRDGASGERYELRDPFAEVTYRADTFGDIVARAAKLGSSRFTAIAPDGARTVFEKAGAEWRRGVTLPPGPRWPVDYPSDPGAEPAAGTKSLPCDAAPQHAQIDAKAAAALDAQAEREALNARLEAALNERYVIKRAPVTVGTLTVGQTEYRFRGDSTRVAFTETSFRLATDTNSPSVARSMVDVAQARSWKGLRVSGTEDFRRMVWLEASVRGIQAIGYEPNADDLLVLKREREARQTNRVEPSQEAASSEASAASEKASVRGGGRQAIVAAIDAVLMSRHVPESKRVAVLAAVNEKLAQRARGAQMPKVKVFDLAARPQQPGRSVTPMSRTHDRAAPAHAR
jgi:hypothetical protein